VLATKLDAKTQQFHDFRDKLADPRFFSPIKSQLENATSNAHAARTGGPIIVDKFLIPEKQRQYQWLTENMQTINDVYEKQR
jgi:hypothetical protein